MVTRKPLPTDAHIHSSAMRPPQPTQQSPLGGDNAASEWEEQYSSHDSLNPLDVPESLRPGVNKSASQSSLEEENVWVDRPGTGQSGGVNMLGPVPSVLRPGPPRPKTETNPFLKRKVSGTSPNQSQEAIHGEKSSTPEHPRPMLPTTSFSNLSLGETSNNPWQPALDETKAPPMQSTASDLATEEEGGQVWGSRIPSRQMSPAQTTGTPALLDMPPEDAVTPWSDPQPPQTASALPPMPEPQAQTGFGEDDQVWNEVARPNKGKGLGVDDDSSGGPADDWDTLGEVPRPASRSTSEQPVEVDAAQRAPLDEQPPLPPRKAADDAPPPPPPRPVPNAKAETYQIKNIDWFDVKATRNPRRSPILVQNANGPCPLVALVNALVLTTPAEMNDTALIESLRSREQVSLGLLLDAVFDELMSPRRLHEETALPDMTELYDFLKGLHTGMNVNPRFVPTEETVRMFKRTSLAHLHPSERGDVIPGTFEDTKEMALYSTFSIPLIHGWLPRRDEAVYDALSRRAVSYEDAQHLLFREEELEDKLSNTRQVGLTEEEQEVYQDILTIKSFLSISATQLTPWGLEVVTKAMNPGSVAILFRNDHFSTLYRHPQTLQLLTLVTDAGYAGHHEVVWESLNDVNGEAADFFSGDFLLVGGAQAQSEAGGGGIASQRHSSAGLGSHYDDTSNDSGWTTVQGRRGQNRNQSSFQNDDEPPLSPVHEQEDRDMALAMQLQEEEDQRARTEQERRQRESLLSEQYIEQQAQQSTTGAGGGAGGGGGGRGGGGVGGGGGGGGGAGTRGGRGSTPTLTPGRRTSSVSSSSLPLSAPPPANGRGRGNGSASTRGRAPQQPVRSLIPASASGTHRPAEEGVDDAPPSYEQAAKQTPYVPPEGHPTHPSSSPDARGAGPSSPPAAGPPFGLRRQSGGQGGFVGGPGPAPGPGGRFRQQQGMPPPAVAGAGGPGRDKDCLVM